MTAHKYACILFLLDLAGVKVTCRELTSEEDFFTPTDHVFSGKHPLDRITYMNDLECSISYIEGTGHTNPEIEIEI